MVRQQQALALFFVLWCCSSVSVFAHRDHSEEEELERKHYETRALSARSLHDFDIATGSQLKIFHVSSKRSMLARNQQPQPFPDDLTMELSIFDTTVLFTLTISEHLFHRDAKLTVRNQGRVLHEGKVEHRYYQGTATSSLGSGWARITVMETLSGNAQVIGAFVQNGVIYYIKTPEHFSKMTARISSRSRHLRKRALDDDVSMVVYRASDIEVHDAGAFSCGVTEDFARHFNWDPLRKPQFQFDSQNLSDVSAGVESRDLNKRVPTGCPSSIKVVYMGVVADGNYVAYYGSTSQAQTQALTDWNLANAVYNAEYNYYLGILSITTEATTGSNPSWNVACSGGPTITDRLSLFSQWRGSQTQNAGLYHLLSTCATLPTIGIAWLNQLCQSTTFSQADSSSSFDGGTQYVSGCAVSTVVDEEWLVVAHEIGHNFGSVHDCISSTCPASNGNCNPCGSGCDCQGQYIMNPSETGSSSSFSPGSQTQICTRSSITGTCLADPGSQTVLNTNVCGNGILEAGEQCDCGGTSGCCGDTKPCIGNACCYLNCTLIPPAVCNNDTNTQCCKNCQVNPNTNTLCRAKTDPICDTNEYCNGVTAACPPDVYTADGTPCTANVSSVISSTNLKCASGVCTSRDLQCYQRAQAEGNTDGYTQDCGPFSGSCQMFCSSPLDSCTFFYAVFRNGTTCGDNGFCNQGVCSDPDLIGTIIEFIQQNVVMVAIGGAMVGILLIGFLVWGCQTAGRKEIDTAHGKMSRFQSLGRSMTLMTRRGAGQQRPRPTADVPMSPRDRQRQSAQPRTSQQQNRNSQQQQHRASQQRSPSPKPPQQQTDAPPPYEAFSSSSSASAPPINVYAPPPSALAIHNASPRPSFDAVQHGRQGNRMSLDVNATVAMNGSSPGRQSAIAEEANGSRRSSRNFSEVEHVRCPICNAFFPSEAALNTHLDIDHA